MRQVAVPQPVGAAQGSAGVCRPRAQPCACHSARRTSRALPLPRHARPGSLAAAAAQPTTAVADTPPLVDAADTWASFAAAASGEWEGVTASFDASGAPQQLPEYYVPQAYRDWGVELYDWQSQSSMLGGPEGLTATNRRMMPTVGCEADAIAFTQDERQLFSTAGAGAGAPPTVAADGSYSAGPVDLPSPDETKAALEACLVLAPGQRRLRVVHNLQRWGAERAWRLESLELHSERYDSPYRGKLELSGCGGGMKGFATSQALGADELRGPWVASGLRYACTPDGCCCAEAVSGEAWSVEALPALLLHPLGAWSSCQAGGEGGADIVVAAGALLDDGRMVVATRRYQGGRLAAAELLTLARA